MDSRSNATATGASYDASGLIRFGCETNRGKGVTNRVTVNQVPYRCILRGGNRMCQAIRSCCDNRRLRTALEITERLCYDSRRASRRREHTCARSSGDRAFGCGPKGRGFKSLRAYSIGLLRWQEPFSCPLACFQLSGILPDGEVSEWLKVPISKIGVADEVTVGSNPTLSADLQPVARVHLTAPKNAGR